MKVIVRVDDSKLSMMNTADLSECRQRLNSVLCDEIRTYCTRGDIFSIYFSKDDEQGDIVINLVIDTYGIGQWTGQYVKSLYVAGWQQPIISSVFAKALRYGIDVYNKTVNKGNSFQPSGYNSPRPYNQSVNFGYGYPQPTVGMPNNYGHMPNMEPLKVYIYGGYDNFSMAAIDNETIMRYISATLGLHVVRGNVNDADLTINTIPVSGMARNMEIYLKNTILARVYYVGNENIYNVILDSLRLHKDEIIRQHYAQSISIPNYYTPFYNGARNINDGMKDEQPEGDNTAQAPLQPSSSDEISNPSVNADVQELLNKISDDIKNKEAIHSRDILALLSMVEATLSSNGESLMECPEDDDCEKCGMCYNNDDAEPESDTGCDDVVYTRSIGFMDDIDDTKLVNPTIEEYEAFRAEGFELAEQYFINTTGCELGLLQSGTDISIAVEIDTSLDTSSPTLLSYNLTFLTFTLVGSTHNITVPTYIINEACDCGNLNEEQLIEVAKVNILKCKQHFLDVLYAEGLLGTPKRVNSARKMLGLPKIK